jgi:putative restriction endonuclease
LDATTAAHVRSKIERLNIWTRGDERAPHKPLLVLLALSRVADGKPRLASFAEIEGPLKDLLELYGPPRRSHHPEYPFWRLQADDIWVVPHDEPLRRRKSNTDPLKTELIRKKIAGGFTAPVYDLFRADPQLLRDTVLSLIRSHFPESMHKDLLSQLGFMDVVLLQDTRRSVAFRQAVIQAYEHRCAVCGYEVRIGSSDLALEAAHIKWRQARGPDLVQNGLALCAIHHKALDRGAIGINQDYSIAVSAELYGQGGIHQMFTRFSKKQLKPPHSGGLLPDPKFLAWHEREVFRGPARR